MGKSESLIHLFSRLVSACCKIALVTNQFFCAKLLALKMTLFDLETQDFQFEKHVGGGIV